MAGLFDEVGDLGGVQLRELAVGMRRRAVGTCDDERLDGGEVDDRLGLHARADVLAEESA